MKFLILTLLLCSTAFAQTIYKPNQVRSVGGGGNGQLVVIPKGHTNPVPYESVRAWETAKYLNFYRLPNLNGNIENRENFNRDYAVHAQKWLDLIKGLSPKLHMDLVSAAKVTPFRIINDLIAWQAEPGALATSYKKFEKAAYYNNEIILSTPVIDKIGPLSNALTKEQNQGYVIIHELINVAYPRFSMADKLAIGEAILRVVMYNDTKVDFNYHLCQVNSYFLTILDSNQDFSDLLEEVINFEEDQKTREYYSSVKDFYLAYMTSHQSAVSSAITDIKRRKITKVEDIQTYLNKTLSIADSLKFQLNGNLLNVNSITQMSKDLNISLYDLRTLKEPKSQASFNETIMQIIMTSYTSKILALLPEKLPAKLAALELINITNQVYYLSVGKQFLIEEFQNIIQSMASDVKDENNYGFKSINLKNQLMARYHPFYDVVSAAVNADLCQRVGCLDLERTKAYYEWYKTINDPLQNGTFPFILGSRFMNANFYKIYHVVDLNLKKQEIKVKFLDSKGKADTTRYAKEDDGNNNNNRYEIESNLTNLIFLKN